MTRGGMNSCIDNSYRSLATNGAQRSGLAVITHHAEDDLMHPLVRGPDVSVFEEGETRTATRTDNCT